MEHKHHKHARFAARKLLPKFLLKRAKKCRSIEAASPYVTDSKLFKNTTASVKKLYTCFDAMNFISGASSIQTLRAILNESVLLYHTASLHAKVVIIDGKYFSIGSQNLTHKGKRNIEANVISGKDTAPDGVLKFFSSLEQKSSPITHQDIDIMEKLISPFIMIHDELQKSAADINKEIEITKLRLTSEKIQKALSTASSIVTAPIMTSVKTLENQSQSGTTWTSSLIPSTSHAHFTSLISELGLSPKNLSRYLLINEDNGQLAFIRIAKTRITYFGSGITPSKKIKIGKINCKTSISFQWPPPTINNHNGKLYFGFTDSTANSKDNLAYCSFSFSISDVDIGNIEIKDNASGRLFLNQYEKDSEAKQSIQSFIKEILTTPFKYTQNLCGKEAEDFFEYNATIKIKAHRIDNTAILSAKRVS
jgi:hypothetical protein